MTPELKTTRLRLSPFRLADISGAYVAWLNDPNVVRHSENRHRAHSRETCASYVSSFDHKQNHLWKIEKDGKHIGNISAHRNSSNLSADVGILIGDSSEWGSGYGTEAWLAVLAWLLESGASAVTGGTKLENKAMIRIFHTAGMTELRQEGAFVYYKKHA
jgi:RimJ/RimL family protein N-acetyltransferase